MDRLSFQMREQLDYLKYTLSPYIQSGSRAAQQALNSAYIQLSGSRNGDIPFTTWLSWRWAWFCECCGDFKQCVVECLVDLGSTLTSLERRLSANIFHHYLYESVDRTHICFFAVGVGTGLLMGIQLGRSWWAASSRSTARMRAVVCNSYKGAESIAAAEDQPAPSSCGPEEVVIQVRASSIDPVDLRICGGYGRVIRQQYHRYRRAHSRDLLFPFVLGRECSGRIVEIGSRVSGCVSNGSEDDRSPVSSELEVGDEVYAAVPYYACGVASELACLPAAWVARKPKRLSYEAAAALPYSASLAWNVLVRQAGLNHLNATGKRILVVSADNTVGCMAAQLAKSWGAHVTAAASSRSLPTLQKLGVLDDIILHDNTASSDANSYATILLAVPSDKKFDIVLNTVGSFLHNSCLDLCSDGGLVVSAVASPPASDRYGLVLGSVYSAWLRLKLAFKGSVCSSAVISRPVLDEVARLVDTGQLQPVIERVFDVDQAEQAGHHAAEGDTVGKIVIRFRNRPLNRMDGFA